MAAGRLIRVRKYRGASDAVAYIVAAAEKTAAVELISKAVAKPGDEVEDLGGVSEALLEALCITPGDYQRIDGIRHVAQQQQQPQPNDKDKPE